jgi:hypothetical protein
MTKVASIRVPSGLVQAIRRNAARSGMTVSAIAGLILEHSLTGQYNLEALLEDIPGFLDAKLDFRCSEELIANLRDESQRLQVSVSVYIRMILCAYYTKRLVFVERDGHYTLEENRDQTKSA